jgi:hypothetical protein
VINPTTYIRRPFEVLAVEVTPENMEEVAEWCSGYLDADHTKFGKVDVKRALNERQTKAYPGDWVLHASTGFKVYTPNAFHKTFEIKIENVIDGGAL